MWFKNAFVAVVLCSVAVSAQVTHIMTGKVVKDTTFTACTYNPDATEQVSFYNTLSNGLPLFIMISGMS